MKVTLLITTTIDGFISRDSNDPAVFREAYDQYFFDDKTKELGTVVYGMNTFRTLDRPFDGRLNIVMSTLPNVEETIPGTLEFFSGSAEELLADLEKRGINEIALIGGGQLNGSFFNENLVDEVYLTVAPLLFGQGVNLATGYDLEAKLKLLEVRPLGDEAALIHYQVLK